MTPEERHGFAGNFATIVKRLLAYSGQEVEPSLGPAAHWLEREIMKTSGVHLRYDAIIRLLEAHREPTFGEACAIATALGYEVFFMQAKEGK